MLTRLGCGCTSFITCWPRAERKSILEDEPISNLKPSISDLSPGIYGLRQIDYRPFAGLQAGARIHRSGSADRSQSRMLDRRINRARRRRTIQDDRDTNIA